MFNYLGPHELQHVRILCPLLCPGVCWNSCPLSWWCYLTIYPLLTPSPSAFFLSKHHGHLQWVGSFIMSWLFTSGRQSIGTSASASVLSMHNQGRFPLDRLAWSPSRPRDSQKSSPAAQFEGINSSALSLFCDPDHTTVHDYWKNHSFDFTDFCWQSDVSAFEHAV